MIKFHPTDSILASFVEGLLPSESSLLVSAHVDMCVVCCKKSRSLTDSIAKAVFNTKESNTTITRDYMSMFESITNDTTLVDASVGSAKIHRLEVEGRNFMLPPTLARFSDRVGEWSHLLGKLWQAPIDIGGSSLAQLIYIEKGGRVPEHTHKGKEITLVLNGELEDGVRRLQSGDYIALDNAHTHTPASDVNEGCLLLIVLDNPLHFTAGWANLVNPLSQLYFKNN